jgi:hypothetical protein
MTKFEIKRSCFSKINSFDKGHTARNQLLEFTFLHLLDNSKQTKK